MEPYQFPAIMIMLSYIAASASPAEWKLPFYAMAVVFFVVTLVLAVRDVCGRWKAIPRKPNLDNLDN
jgi:hypothetical protein